MLYNIEFQTAGFVFVTMLIIIFFSKPRWKSVQNSVFRVLLILTWLELACDIISVITISEREKIPSALNNFFSKGYIVIMFVWITTIMLYLITNTFHDGMSGGELLRKKILFAAIAVPALCCIAAVFFLPLQYAGEGRYIYSYGAPSVMTYLFSIYCVITALVSLALNFRHMTFDRKVPALVFTLMEGAVALVQMFNPTLLILGFGMAVCIFIMYMTMENPDMDMIAKLNAANERSTELLLNILPASVVTLFKKEPSVVTKYYNDASIVFIDIVDFTKLAAQIGPKNIVDILNRLFSELDIMLDDYHIEKIKTIGDAYMVASGIPEEYPAHCEEALRFSLAVMRHLEDFNGRNGVNLRLRIGVASGPCVAGVIGKKKFIYDVWGATVNFASRMESSGVPGKIQVSRSVYEKLSGLYRFEKRERVAIKGCGECDCYLLSPDFGGAA